MTDHQHERDPLLASLLAEAPVADHADGFWADLDRRLADEARPAPDGSPASDGSASSNGNVDRRSAVAASGPFAGPSRSDDPDGIAVIEPKGGSNEGRRWLAVAGAGLVAAAAIVAALFGFGVLGGAGPGSSVIQTDPADGSLDGDGSDAEADAPEPPSDELNRDSASVILGDIDYTQPSAPRALGSGSVVGFSPDDTSVLVLGEHPSGQTGSEGAAVLTVWAYPVGGGEPTLSLDEEVTIETGTSGADFAIGSGGDIAWVEHCDGVVCGVRTAVLRPGGEIVDVVDLDSGELAEQLSLVEADIIDLAVGADGTTHLAANGRLGAATRGLPWVDVAVDIRADALVIVELAGGGETLLTWNAEDGVLRSDSPITDQVPFEVTELVPLGRGFAAVFGDVGFGVVDLETGEITFEEVDLAAVFDVGFSPDGSVTAIITAEGLQLEAGDDGDDLSGPLALPGARSGVFSSNGAFYAVTTISEAGEQAVLVIDFPPMTSESTPAGGATDEATGGELVEIASFTTEFACCQGRVTNIELMAQATDGLVVPDGATFSLNEAAGERTEERGYVPAGAIVNGILEPVIGGGVSQYATTLFNAAFFGGMAFEEYESHWLYISRYPFGRDASLSWPKPDLVLRNDTGHDITIRSTVTADSVTVELWSTGSVKVETGDTVRSTVDSCTQAETERTRTFPDGTVVQDTIIALYRPGEGWDCNGDPASQTD